VKNNMRGIVRKKEKDKARKREEEENGKCVYRVEEKQR
jgi:hypothetical protein